MKITNIFWITLAAMVFLFILPTLLSAGAPAYDGRQVYGFPLVFGYYGGLCFDPVVEEGVVCRAFNVSYLVIDVLIIFTLPITINWLYHKLSNNNHRSKS